MAFDLSGFSERNVGTHYELQRIVDRFPIERVVFLVDRWTNKPFIVDQLHHAWSHMAAGSPNAGPGSKLAIVVETDYVARSQNAQGGGQAQVRLVARRRQTRRVVAMAQGRLAE